MFEIVKNTKIDFIGKRKYAYILSGFLIFLGLFAFFQILIGKGTLGIEFKGGTSLRVSYEKPLNPNDIARIRSELKGVGLGESEIQQVSSKGQYSMIIRLKEEEAGEGKVSEQVISILKKIFTDRSFKRESQEEIGPAVSKDLQHKAVWAILYAMLAITIYIWIRFKTLDFGIAAAIATIHDVFSVLGIFFLLQKEITLLIVTALLTIAGYSLTDTVVVFDRIRENLKAKRKETLENIINISVNEILSRTLITSLTTIFAVLAILIFGGDVTKDFCFALVIGIIVGTYSSVFVASPILVEWKKIASPRERIRKR